MSDPGFIRGFAQTVSLTEEILEIVKILLPAGLVFAATYFVLRSFLQREFRDQMVEIRKQHRDTLTPVRLQAYERLILFLERISPNNLLLRVHQSGMSAKYLRAELLRTIREEYEHNLSQQIYVSNKTWDLVKRAKEEMIKLINTEAEQLKDDATGIDLSKKIFNKTSQMEQLPTQVAANYLKNEVRNYFA